MRTALLLAVTAAAAPAAEPYSPRMVEAYRASHQAVPHGRLFALNDGAGGAVGPLTLDLRRPEAPHRPALLLPVSTGSNVLKDAGGRPLVVGLDWGVRAVLPSGLKTDFRLLADAVAPKDGGFQLITSALAGPPPGPWVAQRSEYTAAGLVAASAALDPSTGTLTVTGTVTAPSTPPLSFQPQSATLTAVLTFGDGGTRTVRLAPVVTRGGGVTAPVKRAVRLSPAVVGRVARVGLVID
jgi:hypothetical protein